MATNTTCDICGKEVTLKTIRYRIIKTINIPFINLAKQLGEVCDDCMNVIANSMAKKQVTIEAENILKEK